MLPTMRARRIVLIPSTIRHGTSAECVPDRARHPSHIRSSLFRRHVEAARWCSPTNDRRIRARELGGIATWFRQNSKSALPNTTRASDPDLNQRLGYLVVRDPRD